MFFIVGHLGCWDLEKLLGELIQLPKFSVYRLTGGILGCPVLHRGRSEIA